MISPADYKRSGPDADGYFTVEVYDQNRRIIADESHYTLNNSQADRIEMDLQVPECPKLSQYRHDRTQCQDCERRRRHIRKSLDYEEQRGHKANLTTSDAVRESFPPADLAALVDPNRTPRAWLWDGIIPMGEHVSLVAPAGVGKSLLALALALAAALDLPDFIGRKLDLSPTFQVLYVDMENSDDDFAERLPALGVTPENVQALMKRFTLLSLPDLRGLDTFQGAQQLTAILDAYQMKAGDLLVLDSTQRVTEGEENSNDTMRDFYNRTSAELKRREITVLRTDNTGHEERRARGASAKRDDVGASWVLKASSSDPEIYTLEPLKRRSAPGFGDGSHTFRRRSEQTHESQPLFEALSPTPGQTEEDRQKVIWDLLDELNVPLSQGVNKAWVTIRNEKKKRAKSEVPLPDFVTNRRVTEVQKQRGAQQDSQSCTDDRQEPIEDLSS